MPAGAASDRRRFACRWLSFRRAGYARVLSWLSAAFLLAPMLFVYGYGPAADAFRLPLHQAITLDNAFTMFFVGVGGAVLFAIASAVCDAARSEGEVGLTVGRHGLSIRRSASLQRIDRRRIVSGIALSSPKEPCVEIHLADGSVLRAGMRDDTHAEAL